MLAAQMFSCLGRALATSGSLNLKNSHVVKYPTYSSYRGLWSSLIRRKENPAEGGSEETGEKNTEQIQIDDLLKALEEMKQNRDELNDKYKRALAENENIRQRFMKQVEDAKLYGFQGFVKDLLEVADVLNKATESVPKEEVSDSNPHLKNLYEGLTMTKNVLKSVFNRHGLQVLNPINEKFDPNFHEALFEQAVEGKPAGTVVVVSKHGYKLRERVIRPAVVGVSK